MKRRLIEHPSIEHKSFKADIFIRDIIEVYKKHGLSLTHEDCEGGFIIDKLSKDNITWLQNAFTSKSIL